MKVFLARLRALLARAALLVVLIAALTACDALIGTGGYSFYDLTLEELNEEIEEEIGEAEASSKDQCALIAFGSKPCGGPWTYLVYSTAASNEARLEALVEQYNKLEAERNRKKGLGSDCGIAPKPEIVFEENRCVAADALAEG